MVVLQRQLAAISSKGDHKLRTVKPEYIGEIDWRNRNVNNLVAPSAGAQRSEVPVCETESRASFLPLLERCPSGASTGSQYTSELMEEGG